MSFRSRRDAHELWLPGGYDQTHTRLSPVGAAPTSSSFSIKHLASMDWAKITARWDEKYLSSGIWSALYYRFGSSVSDKGHYILPGTYKFLILLSASREWYPVVQGPGCRGRSGHGLSQWETTIHCNLVSHWLIPYTEGNKIWWLCLVPTSTTRFASDARYRMAKKWIGLYTEIFFYEQWHLIP